MKNRGWRRSRIRDATRIGYVMEVSQCWRSLGTSDLRPTLEDEYAPSGPRTYARGHEKEHGIRARPRTGVLVPARQRGNELKIYA